MTIFKNYDSNEDKQRECRTSANVRLRPWSTKSSITKHTSSHHTRALARAGIPRATITCLQNCLDAFRDSILPYDEDFDKICAILAQEDDAAVFSTLYTCDEGCGAENNGTSARQDSNVNSIIVRCQSLGFSSVVDLGTPPLSVTTGGILTATTDLISGSLSSTLTTTIPRTGSITGSLTTPLLILTTTISNPSTLTVNSLRNSPSTNRLNSQTVSPNGFRDGQSSSVIRLATKSSSLPIPTSSDQRSTASRTLTRNSNSLSYSIQSAESSTMSHTTVTTYDTVFSTTTETMPSLTATSMGVNNLIMSVPTESSTSSIEAASRTPILAPSSPPTSALKMLPKIQHHDLIIALVLGLIGIVILTAAAVIIILVCRKDRARARSRTCTCGGTIEPKEKTSEDNTPSSRSSRSALIAKSLPPVPSLEEQPCACCNPPKTTIGFPCSRFPSLRRSASKRAISGLLRGRPSVRSTNSRRGPNKINSSPSPHPSPSSSYSRTEGKPTSPAILTINGVRREIYHPLANLDLRTDAKGIRWPDPVVLTGEAKELWEWSQEYDRKAAEWRARTYDLEHGRKEKEQRRYLSREEYGRAETVREGRLGVVVPRRTTSLLPIEVERMNEETKFHLKKSRRLVPDLRDGKMGDDLRS